MCVTRDIEAYLPKLCHHGIMVFHDASPKMQGRDPQDYPGDHDMELARTQGIAVRKVLDQPGFCDRYGLELVSPAPDQQFGGVEIYRNI